MSFITLEGIEGSGKSTQARRLGEALGPHTLVTWEPGATPLGTAIRSLLLDHRDERVAPAAESLLFFADRAQHVAQVIRPALAAGRTVVCDRYVDSSIAYQGYGRGLPLDLMRRVAQFATGGLKPDLTLLLDVPVEAGLGRVGRRGNHDRLEAEERAFHERVRQGYLDLVAQEPQRWVRIDACVGPDEVERRILEAVEAHGYALAGRHGVS